MKSRTGFVLFVLGAALLIASPLVAPAAAQSVFVTRGLGYPLEPMDARSRGLGGVSLGLPDPELSWANPAASVGMVAPGLTFAYQYDNFESDELGEGADGKSARFPLFLAGIPVGERFNIQLGIGSFLDQNWQLERADTLVLDTDSIPFIDRITSDGGVTRMRVGLGYELVESVALGAAVDFYRGALTREQGRVFPAGDFVTGRSTSRWHYGGAGYTLGAEWSPTDATGISASIGYGGTLETEIEEGEGDEVSYDLPIMLRGGGSARIGQATLLAVSGSWNGWSSLDEALGAEGGARDSWMVGGGVEWDGITLRARPLPLRLGARTGTLPFRWGSDPGTDWANERAVSIGAGLLLAGGVVRSDLAAEFGSRGGESSGVEESFWRFAFSVRVLGQ